MSWAVDSVQCPACALYLLMLFQGLCATILLLKRRNRAKFSIISVVLASPFEGPQCLHYSSDATRVFKQVSPFNAHFSRLFWEFIVTRIFNVDASGTHERFQGFCWRVEQN